MGIWTCEVRIWICEVEFCEVEICVVEICEVEICEVVTWHCRGTRPGDHMNWGDLGSTCG